MTTKRRDNAQTLSQVPPCPLCHLEDQVQPAQTAYERGQVRMQAPSMPRKTKIAWIWIALAVLVYGGANFYLFAQLGGGPGFGSWPVVWQVLEIVVIEIVLVVGLALSLLAFGRLLRSQRETTWVYPTQDERAAHEDNLYYCRRDNVTFDEHQHIMHSPGKGEDNIQVLPPESGHPTVEER